jgi:hypothetical protein
MPDKKKPGRKPKNKKIEEQTTAIKVPKKRGRKPKGGKIIDPVVLNTNPTSNEKPNIILHLRCTTNDYENSNIFLSDNKYNPSVNNVKSYDNNLYANYDNNSKSPTENIIYPINNDSNTTQNKEQAELFTTDHIIMKKLKILNGDFQNVIDNKKSNCFWCTYSFDNHPCYIPKFIINNTLSVYGHFCSPECSMAYLECENIDSSTKWERVALLNNIYGKIYKYKQSIKPAPVPFYTLEKYYGNLTIEEYRQTFKYDKLLLIINKPLTQVIPEIYQDNNEFNKTGSYISNNTNAYVKTNNIFNSFKMN